MTDKEISWDEAISSGAFVTIPADEQKVLKIKDWKLVKTEKFGEQVSEFQSTCVEEDGKPVDKQFTTTSNRLKKKLRVILEGKDPKTLIKFSVLKVGDKFDTQYSVKFIE